MEKYLNIIKIPLFLGICIKLEKDKKMCGFLVPKPRNTDSVSLLGVPEFYILKKWTRNCDAKIRLTELELQINSYEGNSERNHTLSF